MRIKICAFFILCFIFTLLCNSLAYSQWTTSTSEDEMTGDKSYYAMSPSTSATKTMDFPYRDVITQFVVGCDDDSQWVYFWFSQDPNLTGGETHDEYNTYKTRLKFDEEIETIELQQDWSSKFVHIRRGDLWAIRKAKASSTALLELEWHGEGNVYFRYSLSGSARAINEIQSKCGK